MREQRQKLKESIQQDELETNSLVEQANDIVNNKLKVDSEEIRKKSLKLCLEEDCIGKVNLAYSKIRNAIEKMTELVETVDTESELDFLCSL